MEGVCDDGTVAFLPLAGARLRTTREVWVTTLEFGASDRQRSHLTWRSVCLGDRERWLRRRFLQVRMPANLGLLVERITKTSLRTPNDTPAVTVVFDGDGVARHRRLDIPVSELNAMRAVVESQPASYFDGVMTVEDEAGAPASA